MTSSEHSIMVYLLLSIERVPIKALDLLSLASQREASDEYHSLIKSLKALLGDEEALLDKCKQIRHDLRVLDV